METDLKSYRSEFVPLSCNQGLKLNTLPQCDFAKVILKCRSHCCLLFGTKRDVFNYCISYFIESLFSSVKNHLFNES